MLLKARTSGELAEIAGLVVGRSCDLRSVALDDQGGKLHVPLVDHSDGGGAVSELIVRRVVEFSVHAARGRRVFDVDGLSYDRRARRVSIRSEGRLDVVVTVERLDVALRMRPRRMS
ncbi:MAG: hypothetical protein ACRD0C_21090 [Acidimicrobiia bacterium]